MIKIFSKFKIIFYFTNFCLISLYLFPGSLLGMIMYDNKSIQPQITSDFLISSNHFYAFVLVSAIGFFSFIKSNHINPLIIYLVFLSIFLEIFHLIIPERSFQFTDLFGNLVGVIIVIIIFYFFKKNENFKN